MDIAPGHAGAASGLVNTGFGIAGVLSPAVFGVLLDVTGGDWRVPLLLSVVILGIGALCALRVNPRRHGRIRRPLRPDSGYRRTSTRASGTGRCGASAGASTRRTRRPARTAIVDEPPPSTITASAAPSDRATSVICR